ncbi:hypothetical protein M3Y97_00499600 [Aphelenchoides bicaudatus]|nr:hypothetical protein M3Y97_00499600 [Aphelenchoides bicaudatus]
MTPLPDKTKIELEENERHIYMLGLAILFGWILVVILCAAPHLFLDLIKRYLCCYRAEHKTAKKVKEAQERLRRASQNFLGTQLAIKPSSILLHQVMGPDRLLNPMYSRHLITEPILEERGASVAPSENCDLEKTQETKTPVELV